jgi:hypothetical protein
MSNTVTLRHVNHTLPLRVENFYDGHAVARDGLLTLPAEQVTHLQAAYFRGYQYTPDGKWLADIPSLDRYIAEQTAKSAERDNHFEGDYFGRQPAPKHRVRSSQ